MGDVFSPVNQFRGSFSHAESRSEKTNRARLTTIKKATCFSKLKSQALNRHQNSPTMFEFSFTYVVYVFQLWRSKVEIVHSKQWAKKINNSLSSQLVKSLLSRLTCSICGTMWPYCTDNHWGVNNFSTESNNKCLLRTKSWGITITAVTDPPVITTQSKRAQENNYSQLYPSQFAENVHSLWYISLISLAFSHTFIEKKKRGGRWLILPFFTGSNTTSGQG